MVELREITQENFDEILALEVDPTQTAFVSTVEHSLAQAWLHRECAFPFAIYADGIPVGFVMLGYYEARAQYTLWKFLIDKKYQGKGYGRQALQLAMNWLTDHFEVDAVYTGVSFGNKGAKHLYLSFGFQETGRTEGTAEELKYICAKHSV